MSLSPPAASGIQVTSVLDAIRSASARTGVDFGYLRATALRESSLDPAAKSNTSSATGLFQFIEQTWLATLKRHGADHGLAEEATAIETGASGRLCVADPAARSAILALRNDPVTASLMAAELTRDSQNQMEASLGRPVSDSELYLAHFLGPREAARFVSEAEASPSASAVASFPIAASANRSIFFSDTGEERSLAEVRSRLATKQGADTDIEAPPSEPRPMLGRRAEEALSLASWFPGPALRLTPQILTILSSLDPIPEDA